MDLLMKRFYLLFCLLILCQSTFSQDQDTIFNFLEGKWEWYKTYRGGYAGGYIYPIDSGFNITIEFNALQNDSVNFYLYKNDTLIWDTITAIFPIDTISFWGINKNVIPVLKKYFYIFRPIEYLDYLVILIEDNDHITFLEPSQPEGPSHYFERKINNTIQKNNNECLINIYPNPINDYIYVAGLPEGILSIEIFDITGRNVYKETIKNRESYCIRPIGLSKGIYFIRIINSSKKELLLFQQIIKI
jgi:hypothetical protein